MPVPRKPLETLDFIANTVTDLEKSRLTKSSELKVDCKCSICNNIAPVTFSGAYKQRIKHGSYKCRSCAAKQNGILAPKGFEKRKQTNIIKYGAEHHLQAINSPHRNNIQIHWKKYITKNGHPMHDTDIKAKLVPTNQERYGIDYTTVLPQCQQSITEKQTSQGEIDLRNYLELITNDKWPTNTTLISPKHIDCYNDKRKFGIEYNGLIWHSEKMGKTAKTHALKYNECKEKGVELITIFEDEWMNRQPQVKNFIKSRLGIFTTRIMARKTNIDVVDSKLARSYINDWHIQPIFQNKYAFGWYYNNELIGIVTLNRHHRGIVDPTQIVLTRVCFKPETQIVGGMSKMMAYLKEELPAFGYKSILTWSDNRWSSGNIYDKSGWNNIDNVIPDYSYVHKRGRVSKQSCKNKFKNRLFSQTVYDKANELGYYRIWDCGKKTWFFKL